MATNFVGFGEFNNQNTLSLSKNVSFEISFKGPSKNVNIFMSVQTPPSPLSVQTNIFGFQNMGFMHNIYYATTKINPSFEPI